MNQLQKWQAIAYAMAGAFGGAVTTFIVLLILGQALGIQ